MTNPLNFHKWIGEDSSLAIEWISAEVTSAKWKISGSPGEPGNLSEQPDYLSQFDSNGSSTHPCSIDYLDAQTKYTQNNEKTQLSIKRQNRRWT